MRRIVFPKLIGRTYGFNTLPLALNPAPVAALRERLRLATAQPDQISVPASRAVISADSGSPGRSYIAHTEDALNLGPVPSYIDRNAPAANAGKISAESGGGMNGWPYDGGGLFVPHQRIPRKPITVVPFSRTIDTGVTVPSLPIGAPLS